MAGIASGATQHASPDASPAAGTPSAAEEATPAPPRAEEVPAGTPADSAVADEAIAAYEYLVACEIAGDDEAPAALITPQFLENDFRLTNPYDLRAVIEGSPPLDPVSLENVQTHPTVA